MNELSIYQSLNYLCTATNWFIYAPLSRCPNRLLFLKNKKNKKGNSAYSCTSTNYCLFPFSLDIPRAPFTKRNGMFDYFSA